MVYVGQSIRLQRHIKVFRCIKTCVETFLKLISIYICSTKSNEINIEHSHMQSMFTIEKFNNTTFLCRRIRIDYGL